ncbi:ADP-ribosylation factor GTPase activating protein, ER-Golgi transport, partial [Ascosphaera acerosa]
TKLGAKKVAADTIDFDEAERRAKEEAENPPFDPAAGAVADVATVVPIGGALHASGGGANAAATTGEKSGRPASAHTKKSSADVDRLGAGVARLGFGQVGAAPKPPAAPAPQKLGFGSVGPSKAAVDGTLPSAALRTRLNTDGAFLDADDELDAVRSKFKNQKGISSDEFFGRDQFDPVAQSEAQQRLTQFEGASAISSNAYFGRPEEEPTAIDDYDGLENMAKDFVRKFGMTAGDDLENLSNLVGEGASRLQSAIRNYLNS